MSFLLRKIVHNEAMRSDPKEIYGWRVYALACSVGFFLSPIHCQFQSHRLRRVSEACSSEWKQELSEASSPWIPSKRMIFSLSVCTMTSLTAAQEIWPSRSRRGGSCKPFCQYRIHVASRLLLRRPICLASGRCLGKEDGTDAGIGLSHYRCCLAGCGQRSSRGYVYWAVRKLKYLSPLSNLLSNGL